MDKEQFIRTLGMLAQKEAKKRSKWVLPSICIAQAALETGWGKSALMTKANAFFGIKAGKSWKGKIYNTKTKECYDGKTFITIRDGFRAYNSLAESVADYYDLITNDKRYEKAVCQKDPEKCIMAIKKAGYATDPGYVSLILSLVETNHLTEYDWVVNGRTAPVSQSTIYVVKKGDTLTKIAKKYNKTVSGIVEDNKTRYPEMTANYIQIGWKLKL